MKKIYFLMLLGILCACSAMAQPASPADVQPGSKGKLSLAGAPQRPEKTFAGFYLETASLDSYCKKMKYELKTDGKPSPDFDYSDFTCVMQKREGNEWKTVEGSENRSFNSFTDVYLPGAYRIKITEGVCAGYVSNVVDVKGVPQADAYFSSWWAVGVQWSYPYVGEVLRAAQAYFVKYIDDKRVTFTSNDADPEEEYRHMGSNCTKKWYRRNPYTSELTEVKPTEKGNYKLTPEDVGYEILYVIQGQGDLSFYYAHKSQIVQLPVCSKCIYAGHDGFVFNTDYILPDPQKNIAMTKFWYEDEVNYKVLSAPFTGYTLEEPVPGQYVMKLSEEMPNWFEISLNDPNATLVSYYDVVELGSEGEDINSPFREFTPGGEESLCTIAMMDGDTIPQATFRAYRKNLSGEVEETLMEVYEGGYASLPTGEYILKASAPGALDTYYPAAATWAEAQKVKTGTKDEVEDEWEGVTYTYFADHIFNINLIPAPAPLTGTGTISGRIRPADAKARQAVRAKADNEDAAGISVLLYNAEKALVATTQAGTTGEYAFQNVPFGTYSVVVDAVEYENEASETVTLTEANPSATDVNYIMTADNKIVSEATQAIHGAGIAGSATQTPAYNLAGQRVDAAYKGVVIRENRKVRY